jgi:hypothetical protein
MADLATSSLQDSRTGRRARQVAIPIALLVPLVLAIVTGVLIYSAHGELPVAQFYVLAAQIIPILMIAFALEGRATALLSDPQIKFYRAQLFVFLLGGEVFALLGASGALRGETSTLAYAQGYVGVGHWSNAIAAGTAAGLAGGFAMLTVLALSGPGWLFLSFRQDPRNVRAELEALREKVRIADENSLHGDGG